MKNWFIGFVLFALVVTPASFAQAALKDGMYQANFAQAAPDGFSPSLSIRVQKGSIVSVVYEETNGNTKRSATPANKAYFDAMARELSSKQKTPIASVANTPANTLDNFNNLSKAILDQAAKAAVKDPIVVAGAAK
jgi:major membrane immunogen (membrane-anchored lipoprotein)